MTVPVIELYTEQSETNPNTTITLTKPSGVQVGELLLLICINDETDGHSFSDNKSGWNFIGEFGSTTSDSIIGLFWRIADGTEPSSEDVIQDGSDEWVAWYARISGVDTTDPINVVGSATTVKGTSVTASAVTTTVDDCLALCFGGFDGGDGYPFTVSGTGWSKEDDGRSGTSGWSDASGVWGKKSMGSADSTLDATIGASANDGMVGVQIAIAPAGGATYTKEFFSDTILKKVEIKEFSTDAILKTTQINSFTSDANLALVVAKTFSTDATIQLTTKKEFMVDSILKLVAIKEWSTDSHLIAKNEETFTADSCIVNRLEKTLTTDTCLLKTQEKTFTTDAMLQRRSYKTLNSDAYLLKIQEKPFTADAALTKRLTETFSADGILVDRLTEILNVDATLVNRLIETATLDSVLKALALIKTSTADAVLQGVLEKTFTSDATLLRHDLKPFDANAVLKALELAESFTADAVLEESGSTQHTKEFSSDVALQVTIEKTVLADGLIVNRITETTQSDAVLIDRFKRVFTVDSVLKSMKTKAFTADAHLQVPGAGWTGEILNVINPQKVLHIDVSKIKKILGVES